MYGTQTLLRTITSDHVFENDVEMYGTQTDGSCLGISIMFENDVEMYGTQTDICLIFHLFRLRMM